MSLADHIFIDMCEDIFKNGVSTEGEKVRPHWEDGSSAYTVKKFGVVNHYDLAKEFPAITLRKTAIKSCTDEILWIWQRKYLGSVGGRDRFDRQSVWVSDGSKASI